MYKQCDLNMDAEKITDINEFSILQFFAEDANGTAVCFTQNRILNKADDVVFHLLNLYDAFKC